MSFLAPIALLSLALTITAGAAETKRALLKDSPFRPAGQDTVAPVAATETIEFAGVSAIGKKTDLIFYDKSAKKSHWVAVGETKEGIAVLNYDSRREQAVVKINGAEKVLNLRKGKGPANSPAPVAPMPAGFNVSPPIPAAETQTTPLMQKIQPPAPDAAAGAGVAPAQPETPATPEAQTRAETEARMLVSDLLEIGMAQRKAYEEAQRRAAQGGDAQQPGTPTNLPGPQPQNPPVAQPR